MLFFVFSPDHDGSRGFPNPGVQGTVINYPGMYKPPVNHLYQETACKYCNYSTKGDRKLCDIQNSVIFDPYKYPYICANSAQMSFKILHSDVRSKARTGVFETDHGSIPTPVFMPVGTVGTVKGVNQRDLKEAVRAPIILGNTYHLFIKFN